MSNELLEFVEAFERGDEEALKIFQTELNKVKKERKKNKK